MSMDKMIKFHKLNSTKMWTDKEFLMWAVRKYSDESEGSLVNGATIAKHCTPLMTLLKCSFGLRVGHNIEIEWDGKTSPKIKNYGGSLTTFSSRHESHLSNIIHITPSYIIQTPPEVSLLVTQPAVRQGYDKDKNGVHTYSALVETDNLIRTIPFTIRVQPGITKLAWHDEFARVFPVPRTFMFDWGVGLVDEKEAEFMDGALKLWDEKYRREEHYRDKDNERNVYRGSFMGHYKAGVYPDGTPYKNSHYVRPGVEHRGVGFK